VTFAVSRAVAQLSRIADQMGTRPIASPAAPAMSTAAPVAPPIAPPSGRGAQPRVPQPDDFGLPEAVEPVRPTPRAPTPAVEEPAPAPRAGWRPPRPVADRATPKPAASRASAASDNPFDSLPAEPSVSSGRAEAATVLKSGIVDGMAYTLYTDGSIEAELAQGVVRFGSIEELRNHLEKSA
jgi:hypothetical protein